jgi:hypothetical protein
MLSKTEEIKIKAKLHSGNWSTWEPDMMENLKNVPDLIRFIKEKKDPQPSDRYVALKRKKVETRVALIYADRKLAAADDLVKSLEDTLLKKKLSADELEKNFLALRLNLRRGHKARSAKKESSLPFEP